MKRTILVVLLVAVIAATISAQNAETATTVKSETEDSTWAIRRIMREFSKVDTSYGGYKELNVGNVKIILNQTYMMTIAQSDSMEIWLDKMPAGGDDTLTSYDLAYGSYVPYSVSNHYKGTVDTTVAIVSEAMMLTEEGFNPFMMNEIEDPEQQQYGAFASCYWHNCLVRAGANPEGFLIKSIIGSVLIERSAAGFANSQQIIYQILRNLYDLTVIVESEDFLKKVKLENENYKAMLEELAQRLEE